MKVFIAATKKPNAAAIAHSLEKLFGCEIVSRWHSRPDGTGMQVPSDTLEDIRRSDVFVILNDASTTGKLVELGYAMAFGKLIVYWNGTTSRYHEAGIPWATFIAQLRPVPR